MPTRTLRLNYPPSLLRQPILNRLIRRFDITVNIVQARITLDEGWLEIETTGEDEEIERAFKWLEDEGIEINLAT